MLIKRWRRSSLPGTVAPAATPSFRRAAQTIPSRRRRRRRACGPSRPSPPPTLSPSPAPLPTRSPSASPPVHTHTSPAMEISHPGGCLSHSCAPLVGERPPVSLPGLSPSASAGHSPPVSVPLSQSPRPPVTAQPRTGRTASYRCPAAVATSARRGDHCALAVAAAAASGRRRRRRRRRHRPLRCGTAPLRLLVQLRGIAGSEV